MAKKQARNKNEMWKKLVLTATLLITVFCGLTFWHFYTKVYSPNVGFQGNDKYFYIPTGTNFMSVSRALVEEGIVVDRNSFDWVADQKNYVKNVKPGRYLISAGMSNNELINLLRSGEQEPVKVTFNSIRFKEELAGKVGSYIEADSTAIIALLNDSDFAAQYGFELDKLLTLFLPNTYEFWWNTSSEQFVERMAAEYKKYWTAERKQKASKLGLSQSEVSILASIVQKETTKQDEKPTVAGVYLNRLNKGMLLQADPTLVYANKDFTARRVLNWHKKIDSPYNTYKYKGLPPGPICLPSISSIDAVLNAKTHNYLYFCAKADGSGYHSFASTYREHLRNAREFQQELNRRKVYK